VRGALIRRSLPAAAASAATAAAVAADALARNRPGGELRDHLPVAALSSSWRRSARAYPRWTAS
jgi:hypothetical protein